ncbi:hypothetical protein HYU22_01275 [Candidatus Woesearchaeota archaeon]|nr:hypothetical protein [Candidatus Woesearchaeota archaeon]
MAINSIVSQSVNDFADYAIAIVTIMIVYYVIRFFMVAPPTKEEREAAEQERQKNARELWKTIGEKHTRSKRRESVRHPKATFVQAIEECDELLKSLSQKVRKDAVRDAKEDLRRLRHHLDLGLRYLRSNRRQESGEIYKFFDQLYAECGAALTQAEHIELPLPTATDWDARIREIKDAVKGSQGIRGVCGFILQEMDNFVEHSTERAAVQQANARE